MSSYRNNLNNMMCLDVFLLESTPKERQHLSNKIIPISNRGHFLLSYDIISLGFLERKVRAMDEWFLNKMAAKFNWQTDFKKILVHKYQALVLTNTEKVIQWVNKGFEQMTGYSPQEAVGRKPTFLQGKNTNKQTRILFRKKLAMKIPFHITVTNYRRDNTEYLCKVQIFPLFNSQNEVSHFLALEQEIK